jgi:transmembrane sensor
MTSTQTESQAPPPSPLGLEAARWLLELRDRNPDRDGVHCDPAARNEAFLDWLNRSPQHVQMFLEAYETYRRLGLFAPQQAVDIENLLRTEGAQVIRIYGRPEDTSHPPTDHGTRAVRAYANTWVHSRKFLGWAAAIAAVAVGVSLRILPSWERPTYQTQIGEQRTCKLDDGSMVYLNTDSVLKVEFSDRMRAVRLVRGEALFAVERESRRPFVVTAGNAVVRVLGTRFNVRKSMDATDVAVVEGAVQVTAADAPGVASPARLSAGEAMHVARGEVPRTSQARLPETLAWRERRLIFRDASLAEAASEFNRYNATQVRVDSSVPAVKRLTGIFDADRPQALVLYAAQDESLKVEPAGTNWVIRGK